LVDSPTVTDAPLPHKEPEAKLQQLSTLKANTLNAATDKNNGNRFDATFLNTTASYPVITSVPDRFITLLFDAIEYFHDELIGITQHMHFVGISVERISLP